MINKKRIAQLVLIATIFAGCNQHSENKNSDLVLTDSATKTRMDEVAEGLPNVRTLKDSVVNLYDGIDSATIARAWEDYGKAGPQHKMIDTLSGTWQEEIKFYPEGVDTPRIVKMTASITPVFNGLYQQTLHRGKIDGLPFEGRGILGFNKAKNKFEYTWLDNWSSGMMYLTGDKDSVRNLINLTGTMADPVTGKEIGVRQTIEILSNKEQHIKLYDTKNTLERMSMEIIMRKNK